MFPDSRLGHRVRPQDARRAGATGRDSDAVAARPGGGRMGAELLAAAAENRPQDGRDDIGHPQEADVGGVGAVYRGFAV